jgi:hypothetical protein
MKMNTDMALHKFPWETNLIKELGRNPLINIAIIHHLIFQQ